MLKGFENKYPPQVNKLAVHPDFPEWLCKWGHRKGSLPHQQEVEYLEMIAFYYLLRVGENTSSSQFEKRDVIHQKKLLSSRFLSP